MDDERYSSHIGHILTNYMNKNMFKIFSDIVFTDPLKALSENQRRKLNFLIDMVKIYCGSKNLPKY